jgi:hypothetical protein
MGTACCVCELQFPVPDQAQSDCSTAEYGFAGQDHRCTLDLSFWFPCTIPGSASPSPIGLFEKECSLHATKSNRVTTKAQNHLMFDCSEERIQHGMLWHRAECSGIMNVRTESRFVSYSGSQINSDDGTTDKCVCVVVVGGGGDISSRPRVAHDNLPTREPSSDAHKVALGQRRLVWRGGVPDQGLELSVELWWYCCSIW